MERSLPALLETANCFLALSTHASYGLVVSHLVHHQPAIAYANPAFYRMTGYSPSEIKTLDTDALFRPRDLPLMRQHYFSRLKKGAPFARYETILVRKDKAEIPVEVTGMHTTWNGHPANLVTFINLSSIKITEAQKHEHEKRYRALAESSPDMIYLISWGGRVLYVNHRAAAYLRRSKQQAIGMELRAVFPPKIAAWYLRSIRSVFRTGKPLVAPPERLAGSSLWIETRLIPMRADDGRITSVMGVSRDVTRRHHAEEAIKANADLFQLLTANSFAGIGVCAVNPLTLQRRLLSCNDRYVQMSGYSLKALQQAKDLNALMTLHAAQRERDRYRRCARKRIPFSGCASWNRPDGRPSTYEWTAMPFKKDGRYFFLEIDHDITDHKRLDTERQQMAARIQAAQENERQNISTTLHDHLGQLLAMAKMETHSIQPADDDSRRRLENATKHIHEALVSIRSLAMMLRTPILNDLGLAMAMKALVEDAARAYHIRATLTHRGKLPVLGMPQQVCLYRVVQEALTNAARHSGGNRIWVTLKANASKVTVQVKDNGRGFSPAHVQANHGLGLAGMRERLAQCGGHLSIAARPRQGAVLTAVCPCRLPPAELPHD